MGTAVGTSRTHACSSETTGGVQTTSYSNIIRSAASQSKERKHIVLVGKSMIFN